MTELIHGETEILVSEGPRKGETLIYVGNTTIKLDDVVHIIYWNQAASGWRAKPYIDDRTEPKKRHGKTWDICNNCKFWHANAHHSYCGKTNDFIHKLPTDSCEWFSKKRWGSTRSKEAIDKQVEKYFNESEESG